MRRNPTQIESPNDGIKTQSPKIRAALFESTAFLLIATTCHTLKYVKQNATKKNLTPIFSSVSITLSVGVLHFARCVAL